MSFATEVENATCRSRAEPVAIWKARKYIEENSREELSLTEVARVVNMNANYLSENFKQVTGTNFVEYVAGVRFANARDLLRNPNLRISEARSPLVFSRSRNSIAFSRDFLVHRRHNIVHRLPACRQDTGNKRRKKTSEKMRCHKFLFLRILAIRVGFEINSMGPR